MKKLIESLKTNRMDLHILVIVSILYLLNNRCIKSITTGMIHEFFVCYFNDLMAPMVMLSYSNILLDTANRRICKPISVILFCLAIGVVWEFFAPLVKKGAVCDPGDFVCYLIGGCFYWLLQKRKANAKNDTC